LRHLNGHRRQEKRPNIAPDQQSPARHVIGKSNIKEGIMTGTWAEFAAAFAVFMLAHRIPTMPGPRARLAVTLGPRGFTIAYSALSTALLIWLIAAANTAPFIPLWDAAPWQRWLANLAMPIAILLAAYAIVAPNPLSFGGRATAFDPAQPGIAGVARHPLLWALALWSTAHLIANGALAHVILFGTFAVFSLAGMAMIDRRLQTRMGQGAWHDLARNTSTLPLAALISRRWTPKSRPSAPRALAALAAYITLYLLHAPVIGVLPTP
jgi:uncharacterized membrane protein